MTGLHWNLMKANLNFFILFSQLVANHVERMQQEEACPHKVLNHVKELAEQLFKNVCSEMTTTNNTYYLAHTLLALLCIFLFSRSLIKLMAAISLKALLLFSSFFIFLTLSLVHLCPLYLSFRRILIPLWRCTESSDHQKTAKTLHTIRRPTLGWTKLQCSFSSTMLLPSSRLRLLWSRQSSRGWCHLGPHWVSLGED